MRQELAKIKNRRRSFLGVFDRFGSKSGYKGSLQTVCLLDIRDVASNKIVTDHLWFTVGKRFAKLDLQKGDIIRFEARVTSYYKGYQGHREDEFHPVELDYRLSFPTKMCKIQPVMKEQRRLDEV